MVRKLPAFVDPVMYNWPFGPILTAVTWSAPEVPK